MRKSKPITITASNNQKVFFDVQKKTKVFPDQFYLLIPKKMYKKIKRYTNILNGNGK